MNQKVSWSLLAAGGCAFLAIVGHTLQAHSTWASVVSPESVGEMLAGLASVGVALLGALGINLKGSAS